MGFSNYARNIFSDRVKKGFSNHAREIFSDHVKKGFFQIMPERFFRSSQRRGVFKSCQKDFSDQVKNHQTSLPNQLTSCA
jgi:hypothetical protein